MFHPYIFDRVKHVLYTVKPRQFMNSRSKLIRKINLHDKLVESGLIILQEKGLQALTLRACAAHCGVSHAAPAHHFRGLRGLLTAIAIRGFEELNALMHEERSLTSDDPHENIIGMCEGYLYFAKTRPALFTLMFNSGQELDRNDALLAASDKTYESLCTACRALKLEGSETLLWSAVHGFSTLQIGGNLRMQDPDRRCDPSLIGDLVSSLKLLRR